MIALPATVQAAATTSVYATVTVITELNIRSGPGTNYAIVAMLPVSNWVSAIQIAGLGLHARDTSHGTGRISRRKLSGQGFQPIDDFAHIALAANFKVVDLLAYGRGIVCAGSERQIGLEPANGA